MPLPVGIAVRNTAASLPWRFRADSGGDWPLESIKRAVTRYEKQASSFKVFTTAKDHGTEASYRIAHCIAKHGKPFTDGEFIKEVNNGAL